MRGGRRQRKVWLQRGNKIHLRLWSQAVRKQKSSVQQSGVRDGPGERCFGQCGACIVLCRKHGGAPVFVVMTFAGQAHPLCCLAPDDAPQMSQYTVAVLIGSLRKDSVNRKLANAVTRLAPKELSFVTLTLPTTLFNEELEAEPPADWVSFRASLQKVHGLLFVTPEYNRSVPAVLKNAVDVASRPYGKSVLAGKPGAVISASPGALGGALANHHLRQSLMFCDVPLLQQPEVYLGGAFGMFNEDGSVKSETMRPFVQKFGMALCGWIDTIQHKH